MKGQAQPLAHGLYVVATPIGNLEDLGFRALRVLREANWVAAEDTRETRKLLDHYGVNATLHSLSSWVTKLASMCSLSLVNSTRSTNMRVSSFFCPPKRSLVWSLRISSTTAPDT